MAVRKKTQKAIDFLEGLHEYVVAHPQLRKKTQGRSETQIQSELRPLLVGYLEAYFQDMGRADYVEMGHRSFYWEGQEGQYGQERATLFGTRNYPDFIILRPYVVAVEYKQSTSGSVVKHGLGQSMVHTMSGEFDFVYFLFRDQSKDGRIRESVCGERESWILDLMWREFNTFVRVI
jgi:hypothetical protein